MLRGEALKTTVNVICYAGHRADVSPRRFFLGERCVEVVEILDQWIGSDHRYFKVRGDDGSFYILRQDTITDTWELTMFDKGSR